MNNEMFQVELSGEFLPYLIRLPGANPEEKLRIVLAESTRLTPDGVRYQ